MLTPTFNPNTLVLLRKARQSELLQRSETARLLKQNRPRKRTFEEHRFRPPTNTLALFGHLLTGSKAR